MATKWTTAEIKKLEKLNREKPTWMTENELAGRLVGQLKKSRESIRWQLRTMREEVNLRSQPAKILLLDIETLPIEAKIWGTYKQNVSTVQIKKDWSIVCWAAKWLFEPDVYGMHVAPQEAIDRKDASILGPIWEMMDEAHMIVTHNGNEFDIKKLNTKFLQAGMPKPGYSKSIDTLEIARKNFAFTYNKMGWINEILGIGTKMETSFEWWDEASEGSTKYLDLMLEYNKNDVFVLEELYLKLRPWMTGHPNMSLFNVDKNVEACPVCGSANLHWNGTYSTPLGLYEAFRCQDCGSIGRSTKKAHKISAAKVQN